MQVFLYLFLERKIAFFLSISEQKGSDCVFFLVSIFVHNFHRDFGMDSLIDFGARILSDFLLVFRAGRSY